MSKEAIVTGVKVREGAVLVDAYAVGRSMTNYSNVPLITSFDGFITVPQEGQKIVITETENGTEYVEGVLTIVGKDANPPALVESEVALQFDPNTKIVAKKNGSGGYDLSIEASGNVDLSSVGDVTINADGNVTIGTAENAVELAVQEHTHDYSTTDSNGDSVSGTTNPPNEDGTTTMVE